MPEPTQDQTQTSTKPEPKIIDIVLDATMLDTFVSCPQKFDLRFNKNKTSPAKATPLDKGDLIHKGNEEYYKMLSIGESFSKALEAAINGYNVATIDSELEPGDVTFLRKVMIENLTYWKDTDARLEVLGIEEPIAYQLHEDENLRITMIGKIDLLVRDPKLGVIPMDHKTYSRDFPVHRKTNQFCNYANAMNSSYLMVNRIGLQTSLPPEKKHRRLPLSYDPLFLQQWKQNVIKWAYFYVQCAADNSWPLNDTSCDKYMRLCEYYPVCDSSGQEAKTYKLNVDFKTSEKWDVAKSLGLDK
jgi:hypothetical protein